MKKKIRIFCSLASFNTGMPISTYKLAAGLTARGRYDVRAVLPEEGELAERLRNAGVGVDIIPFNRVRKNPLSILKFLATWIVAGIRFCRYVGKNRVDIVHFSDIIDAPFYPWAKMAGAKVVGHVRVCAGGVVIRSLYRLWTRIFCDRIVAISRFVKNYYGFKDGRAEVIYNPGPDRSMFDIGAYTEKTSRPSPMVVAVSSFRRDKGHGNFVRIASAINKRANGKIKFTIVGGKVAGHEKYYDEVMELARREGLLDDGLLTVTGNVPIEQVPAVMSKSTALLHVPDWEEALGGVILEAMAMGVAVVAYDRGGVGECFTDGVSGYLVKRGHIDEAVDRVITLVNDKKLRDRITSAARGELDAKFTLLNYVGAVEKIYDESPL